MKVCGWTSALSFCGGATGRPAKPTCWHPAQDPNSVNDVPDIASEPEDTTERINYKTRSLNVTALKYSFEEVLQYSIWRTTGSNNANFQLSDGCLRVAPTRLWRETKGRWGHSVSSKKTCAAPNPTRQGNNVEWTPHFPQTTGRGRLSLCSSAQTQAGTQPHVLSHVPFVGSKSPIEFPRAARPVTAIPKSSFGNTTGHAGNLSFCIGFTVKNHDPKKKGDNFP